MPELFHVDFNLTNACNLACSHCHSASGKPLDDELTTEEILRIVSEAHNLGALSVAFAGGEPFMRRDLLEILSFACGLPGWRVSVITNGLFLTDSTIANLLDRCPSIGLNVSVDGSTPESFGLLRAQPGSSQSAQRALFKRVTYGLRAASGAGLSVSANTTITKATANEIDQTYELVVGQLGAESLVGIKFFPAGYGREHLDLYDFTWPEWAEYFSALTLRKISGEMPLMQLSIPSAWEFYLPLIRSSIDIEQAEAAWRYRSPLREAAYSRVRSVGDVAGYAEICISGNGTAYPTVLMVGEPAQECGNLRHQSLSQLWEKSPKLAELRELQVKQIAHGTCKACSLTEFCGGGSRARSVAESGRLDGPDKACPLIPDDATDARRPLLPLVGS